MINTKQIMTVLIILVALFLLLVIGGWAFIAGLSALSAFAYRRTENRGLLTLMGSLGGLAVGTAVEVTLGLTGGAAILGGLGLGLAATYFVEQLMTLRPSWWPLFLGGSLIFISAWLWSATEEHLNLLSAIRNPALLLVALLIGIQFWRSRQNHKILEA